MRDLAPTFWEMSEEEYLRTEPDSPVKREFFGGYVYPLHESTVAQAGASGGHGRVTLNIGAAFAGKWVRRPHIGYASVCHHPGGIAGLLLP